MFVRTLCFRSWNPLCGYIWSSDQLSSGDRTATAVPSPSHDSWMYVTPAVVSHSVDCLSIPRRCLLRRLFISMPSLSSFPFMTAAFWVLCKESLPTRRWRKYSLMLFPRHFTVLQSQLELQSAQYSFKVPGWFYHAARVRAPPWAGSLPEIPGWSHSTWDLLSTQEMTSLIQHLHVDLFCGKLICTFSILSEQNFVFLGEISCYFY